MKLRKFRTLEDKINLGLKIFCCLLILTIIVMGKSFAEYKQEAEVTFIKARVGKFKTNDIQLAMLLDGEEVETPPSKDNYTVDISCDNADGSWDYVEWLAKIGNIRAGKVKCEVNFTTPAPTISEVTATSEKTSIALSYTASGIGTSTVCKYGTDTNYGNTVEGATNTSCNIIGLEMDTLYYYQVCAVNGAGEVCKTGSVRTKPNYILAEHVEIGDYISMTPTSTNYTILDDLTGYGRQTINPSELNLWRVIKKNADGTIEMISDKVSSEKVKFYGKEGYLKFTWGLNKIASQYTDGVHVLKTRYIGCGDDGNVLYERSDIFSVTTAPWTKSTSEKYKWDSCDNNKYLCNREYPYGGGDVNFINDYKLVNGVYGTMEAYKVGTTERVSYWLASREYEYVQSNWWIWGGRKVHMSGSLSSQTLHTYVGSFVDDGDGENKGNGLRPIVTLKSTTEISSGSGSSVNPYQLS